MRSKLNRPPAPFVPGNRSPGARPGPRGSRPSVTGFLVVAVHDRGWHPGVGTVRKGRGQGRPAASRGLLRPPELVTGSIRSAALLPGEPALVGRRARVLSHKVCAHAPHGGSGRLLLATECYRASPALILRFQLLPKNLCHKI